MFAILKRIFSKKADPHPEKPEQVRPTNSYSISLEALDDPCEEVYEDHSGEFDPLNRYGQSSDGQGHGGFGM